MGLGPQRHLGQFLVRRRDDLGIGPRVVAVAEKERILFGDAPRGGKDTHAGAGFGDREVRIPDRPGVERAAVEGSPRIGRRELHRRDVAPLEPRLLDGGDGEIVGARGAGEAHPLALEIGQGLERRARRQQDGGAGPRSLDRGHIQELGSRGLGEDGRHVAGGAVVDAADIEGFEQGRTERELDPLHLDAQRLQTFLEDALLLGDQQRAAALIAKPQFARLAAGRRRRGLGDGRGGQNGAGK